MKKEISSAIILALILLGGMGLFFLRAGFFEKEECILCITTKIDRDKYVSAYYNEGWFDGYQQARKDIKKLEWCKNQENPTMKDCLQIFLDEDYDFYYRAYRQGLLNEY